MSWRDTSRKRLVGTVVVAALLGLSPGAHAVDYDPGDDEWSGLNHLLVTGQEARVELVVTETLDLSRLRPTEILFWLYPTIPMPVDDLLQFVSEGGHLILADDLGEGDALFEAIGLERQSTDGMRHRDLYQDRGMLPMFTPPAEHFLFFNVKTILANHPAAFIGAEDPVLTFQDPSRALIVEVPLGEGTVLAISDSSLFINSMVRRSHGNKQLGANIMRRFCERPECVVRLLLPWTTTVGAYREGIGKLGALPVVLEEAVALINTRVAALDDAVARPSWSMFVLLLLVAWSILVLRRLLGSGRRLTSPPLALAIPSASLPHRELEGLVEGQANADFSGAARVLLEEVGRRAGHAGYGDLARPREEVRAADRVDPRTEEARRAVLRIQRETDSLQGPEPAVISSERFMRLLGDVRCVSSFLDASGHGAEGTDRHAAGD